MWRRSTAVTNSVLTTIHVDWSTNFREVLSGWSGKGWKGWIGEGRYSGGGVDLLSETYTQLHTIDGLAGPQTYKCLSLGVPSNLIFAQNIGTAVEQGYYDIYLLHIYISDLYLLRLLHFNHLHHPHHLHHFHHPHQYPQLISQVFNRYHHSPGSHQSSQCWHWLTQGQPHFFCLTHHLLKYSVIYFNPIPQHQNRKGHKAGIKTLLLDWLFPRPDELWTSNDDRPAYNFLLTLSFVLCQWPHLLEDGS